jgi:hypothetical protein
VRFAPPLVISEEDLKKAVKIIGECLEDLDKVRLLCFPPCPFSSDLNEDVLAG